MDEKITSTAEAPMILHGGEFDASDLRTFKSQQPIWHEVDIVERQAKDLFEVLNPGLAKDKQFSDLQTQYIHTKLTNDPSLAGDWVYYPWSGALIHCLGSNDQQMLRTNRNRNLITESEQTQLTNVRISIAGLSVGGGMAVSLAYAGIGQTLVLSDFDLLETPNLNRVRAKLAEVGLPKAIIVARQIWEINPYAKIKLMTNGINETNLAQFLGGEQPSDIIFDEIDDFKMKIKLRHAARQSQIPVVMLTGLGDSILVDIERYDKTPTVPLFNGLIGDLEEQILQSDISKEDEKRFAAQIVGLENVPTKALESLTELGKSLVGRPQLGSTVTIESGLAVVLVRKMVLGNEIKSGRYRIDMDELLGMESAASDSPRRERAIKHLIN